MTREEFEKLVDEEFPKAVPEKFHPLLKNLAFLVDTEAPDADLLGLYHGIPHTERGAHYGEGMTLPDTITLYQKTIEEHALEEARHVAESQKGQLEGKTGLSVPERAPDDLFGLAVRKVIRETIWHEVAHYLGYDEDQVQDREDRRESGTL